MTVTREAPAAGVETRARQPWRAVQYLALFGVALVCLEVWTWVSWLASGPAQITRWRDPDDVSWYVARVYEGLMAVAVVFVTVTVVRGCLRERRLTLDAMMIIGGASTLFWDPMVNWLQPNFMYSSQWLNLNTWVGNVPGIPNPYAGLMPQPVFIMLIYPFGLVLFAMGLTRFMTAVRARRPGLSNAKLILVTALAAFLICAALEGPVFFTHLWALPGAPAEFALFGAEHRFPYAEYLTTTMVFTTLGILRYFRNDRGQSLVERGLDRMPRWKRTTISVFATIGWMNGALILLILLQVPTGMHAAPYPNYPAHLVNGLCDAGPFTGTAYGPCPGTPGFRIPLKPTAQ